MTGAVLDLREVFRVPWEGDATIRMPWWLRWFPAPPGFRFRTEITVDGDVVTVHDTQTFANGRTWEREMRSELVGEGRWVVSAPDMPRGARITTSATGFEFTPYTIWAPVLGPIKAPLRCHDVIVLEDEATLLDTIDMFFFGVRVGTLTMRLHRTSD